jgi:PIN domain nuclease of toxin-antitoxin system
VILLDTSALLWLDVGHRRSLALRKWGGRLHVSPANLLELQFLLEAERIRLRKGATIEGLAADERWTLDDPPSVPWFSAARGLSWTRDPFDRLLVAHARYRGWRLATADGLLLERLGDSEVLEL